MTVGDIIGEPDQIHPEVAPKGDRRKRVQDLLDVVGLNPEYINRYPHQFSGGQRQRIGIARGLALRPEIIGRDLTCLGARRLGAGAGDQPDERLQDEFDLSYVFIAHDLSIVRHISDRVGVMYLGRIVETGRDAEIYDHPTHPYTQALLSAVPVPDPEARERGERIILAGDVPSPANIPSGLPLPHPLLEGPGALRAGGAGARGARGVPLVEGPAAHDSACHFAEEKRVVPPEEPPERHNRANDGELR